MNNQNLIIYEFDELYKILIEINNDVNLIIKKASKNDISHFISQPNTLILTQKKISSLEEIWTGDELNKVRQLHMKKELAQVEICKNCDVKDTYEWKRIK